MDCNAPASSDKAVSAMSVVAGHADLASWDRLIHEAVGEPNPTLSNLRVTRAHHLLSLALLDVVGRDGGANFHTWAVWGSRKAGVTIREEGLERALREVTILALCTGLLIGFLLGVLLCVWLPWWVVPALSALGAGVGAGTGRYWLVRGRRRAAELILEGNRTVLQDVGSQTARFVTWFRESGGSDPGLLPAFLEGCRPGKTEDGGQDLLRRAFAQYHRAALVDDPRQKQQAVYLANCLAILHEHIRLQPYIAGSLPWIVRRCVTLRLMRYDVGPLRLAVGDDVPRLEGCEYPPSLEAVTCPELSALGVGDNLAGSRASDWTDLVQRMRYVINLFRALHLHPDVAAAPYTAKQFEQIRAGQVPPGPL